ncbi:MAG: ABC transporter ATP-binding protein [Ilumatobacteraceae bacterium]
MPGDAQADSVLEANQMSVGYGEIPVIRELDLRVKPGQIVALLGANGAGKSTTLMGLSGVLPLSAGRVVLNGAIARGPLHRRSRLGLAYVPEERGILRNLTTLENLRLGRGAPEDALEMMPELKPLLNRKAGLLSGGEQQMLSVARALAAQPKVLLCDELSLGLAPIVVGRLLEKLQRAAQAGLGILLVEQQVRSALQIADAGYVLRRGSAVMSGPGAELLDRLDEIEHHYLSDMALSSDLRSVTGTNTRSC